MKEERTKFYTVIWTKEGREVYGVPKDDFGIIPLEEEKHGYRFNINTKPIGRPKIRWVEKSKGVTGCCYGDYCNNADEHNTEISDFFYSLHLQEISKIQERINNMDAVHWHYIVGDKVQNCVKLDDVLLAITDEN